MFLALFLASSIFCATWAEPILTPLENPPEQIQKFDAKFLGKAFYSPSFIDHQKMALHLGFRADSIKNEFSQPGLGLDNLNLYGRNEVQLSAYHFLKNKKKQWLRLQASASPSSKNFPRYSGEAIAASAIYGQPFELSFGVRYHSFTTANIVKLSPGLRGFLDYGWMWSVGFIGSKAKTEAVKETKWLMGYKIEMSRHYTEENYFSLFFMKNEECDYNPSLSQYQVFSVATTNFTLKHWVSETMALQPEVEWQQKSLENFKNWYTVRAAAVFKL